MLARMLRKGDSYTLLVVMNISEATMENNINVSLKTKNRTTIWCSNSTAGYTCEGNESANLEIYMHSNVHSRIICNSHYMGQPMCSPIDEWIKKMWYIYIYTRIFPSYKKRMKSCHLQWCGWTYAVLCLVK